MNFKLLIVFLILSYVASPSLGQVDSADDSVLKEDLKNVDGNQRKDPSTSIVARPGEPVGLVSRLNQVEAELREKIEDIKTQTTRTSEDQEEKIAIIRARERNLAQLLNQTREEMAGLKTQNRDQSKRIDQLEQKVAMLQNQTPSPPLTRANTKVNRYSSKFSAVSKGKCNPEVSNECVQGSAKVIGMPTSCMDLKLLGHRLNGVYLIKTSLPNQGLKIESVFCDFQSTASVSVSQKLIGSVKFKTKNVFFYAQRNSSFSRSNAIIPWELERLNEGGSFDLATGVFIAPVPGIYHFEFHGIKDFSSQYLDIILQLNENNYATASTNRGKLTGTFDNLSLSSTLRLKANDRVNMFNWQNPLPYPPGILFDLAHLHFTHFSGWLLEEDLM